MKLPSEPLSLDLPFGRKLKRGRNFRARKKMSVEWRRSEPPEYAWLQTQPKLEPLGDFLFLAPTVEDELWLLIERIWAGYPDPPLYGFLAYDLDGRLITGVDFHLLPKAWKLPEEL